MYQTVTESDFIRAFEAIRPENFSRPALAALFDYFEEMESDLGETFEMDVIAICCDWSEYSLEELARDYPEHIDLEEDDPVELLHDETTVITVEHWNAPITYLVQAF